MRRLFTLLAAGILTLPTMTMGATHAGSATRATVAAKSVSGDTFALINGDNADPFFLTIWKGALAQAKMYGVRIVEQAPPTFDPATQLPYLNDEIAKKVSGIILSPDGDQGYTVALQTAKKAGIPVVLVNSDSTYNNNPNIISAFTSSQILLAQLAAVAMGNLLHGKGTVGVVNSVAGSLGDEQRGSYFISTIHAKFPNIKVLPEQYDLDDRAKADSIATDLMIAHPDLSAIYAVDSFTGQGVGTAIQAAHKTGTVKLVAIDAEPQEVTLLKAGVIQALIAQAPYGMGTGAVQTLVNSLTGNAGKNKSLNVLPPKEVTPQNINSPEIQKWVYSSAP